MRYTGEEKKSKTTEKKEEFCLLLPENISREKHVRNSLKRSRVCVMLFIHLFRFPFYKKKLRCWKHSVRVLVLVIQQTTSTHTLEVFMPFTDVETLLVFLLHLIIPGFLIYFVFGIHFYECLCCLILRHLFPTRQLYDVLPCIFSLKIFSVFLLPHALGMKKIIVICCVTFFHSSPFVIFCFLLMSSFRDEWPTIIKRTIKHRTY